MVKVKDLYEEPYTLVGHVRFREGAEALKEGGENMKRNTSLEIVATVERERERERERELLFIQRGIRLLDHTQVGR